MGLREGFGDVLRGLAAGASDDVYRSQQVERAQQQQAVDARKNLMVKVLMDSAASTTDPAARAEIGAALQRLGAGDVTTGNQPPEELAGLGGGPSQPLPLIPGQSQADQKKVRFAGRLDDQDVIGFTDSEGNTFVRKGKKLIQNPEGLTILQTGRTAHDASVSNSVKSKIAKEMNEAEITLRQNVTNIQSIRNLVASPDYVGGTSGDILSAISSSASQIKQLLDDDDSVDQETGEIKETAYNKGTLSRLKRAAVTSDIEESVLKEMAFLHAKSLNPDGKISDADVRAAQKILGSSANKEARLKIIDRMQSRQISNFNIRAKTTTKNIPGPKFPKISKEDILGQPQAAPTPSDVERQSISSRIMAEEFGE